MKVAIGCDHGGFVLKEACESALQELGIEFIDFGTYSTESVDYPDYAEKVCLAIQKKEADKGILLCGTGIGISIAANKFKGIRCAVVQNEFCAEKSAEHNNANVIAMGGRVSTPEEAKKYVKIFFTTQFSGERHQKRVDKISAIERRS